MYIGSYWYHIFVERARGFLIYKDSPGRISSNEPCEKFKV
jgi:hypothetical protein